MSEHSRYIPEGQVFSREFYKNVPEKAVEEIYRNPNITLPYNIDPKDFTMFLDRAAEGNLSDQSRALRVLPYHHRSADVGVTTPIYERIPGGDGMAKNDKNVFLQIDIKGGGFVFPETHASKKDGIEKGSLSDASEVLFMPNSRETPWRYDMLGLVDERMAMGVTDVVQKLSKTGIRSETILGIYGIDKIRLEGKTVTADKLVKDSIKILKSFIKEAKKEGKEQDIKLYEHQLRDLTANADSLDGFSPVEVVRAMRCVFRFRDYVDGTDEERREMLKEACHNLNIEMEELGLPERFDDSTEQGRKKYLEFASYWIGKNVGIIQKAGLCHLFLHMGNWSLAGEMVDLDSVEDIVERVDSSKKGPAEGTFYKMSDDGKSFVQIGTNNFKKKDPRFGLPKCIIKDFRDACFSIRQLVRTMPEMKKDRMDFAAQAVKGYVEGLGDSSPVDVFGLGADRLSEVFSEIAGEVIGHGGHYDPIPVD